MHVAGEAEEDLVHVASTRGGLHRRAPARPEGVCRVGTVRPAAPRARPQTAALLERDRARDRGHDLGGDDNARVAASAGSDDRPRLSACRLRRHCRRHCRRRRRRRLGTWQLPTTLTGDPAATTSADEICRPVPATPPICEPVGRLARALHQRRAWRQRRVGWRQRRRRKESKTRREDCRLGDGILVVARTEGLHCAERRRPVAHQTGRGRASRRWGYCTELQDGEGGDGSLAAHLRPILRLLHLGPLGGRGDQVALPAAIVRLRLLRRTFPIGGRLRMLRPGEAVVVIRAVRMLTTMRGDPGRAATGTEAGQPHHPMARSQTAGVVVRTLLRRVCNNSC